MPEVNVNISTRFCFYSINELDVFLTVAAAFLCDTPPVNECSLSLDGDCGACIIESSSTAPLPDMELFCWVVYTKGGAGMRVSEGGGGYRKARRAKMLRPREKSAGGATQTQPNTKGMREIDELQATSYSYNNVPT